MASVATSRCTSRHHADRHNGDRRRAGPTTLGGLEPVALERAHESRSGSAKLTTMLVYRPQPPGPLSTVPGSELADWVEIDFDRQRPFAPEVVWELCRRALAAEGATVEAGDGRDD